jgi:hypothetical protein
VTEDSKYLDNLFQSKFAEFEAEPPASVWENVHAELHGGKGGSPINPVNLAVLAALVMISGLLGYYIISSSSNAVDYLQLEGHTAMLFEEPVLAHPEAFELPEIIENKIASTPVDNSIPPAIIPAVETEEEKEEVKADEQVLHASLHEYYVETTFGESFSEQARIAKLRARRSHGMNTSMLTMNGIYVRESNLSPRYGIVSDAQRNYHRKASWQMGLFFTPEVIFYPEDSISNQQAYTFEVTGRWLKNDFFVESGLGLSFSSDDGKYGIDYEKFLGSYDDVYNVTFDTTPGGDLVPIYHTNIVNVYDSIDKYKVEQAKNKYTYLQLPVFFGFQKEVNRFGWYVKGGPILSVLVHENIPQPDAGMDKIIAVDQQMPSRVNTYWQFAVGVGVSYKLSNKVSIAVEPVFKYYLNSQYQKKYIKTNNPYSVGLRTGLLFNF